MSAVETPERPDASNFPSVGDKSPTTFSDSPAQAPHNYYYPSSSSDALPNAYSMSHTAYAHNAAYDFYKQFGHFSDPRMNLHQRQHPYTMSETKTSQYNQRANSSNEPSHYDKHRQDANGVCKTEANNEDKESNPVKFSLKANGDSPPPPKLIPIGERTWHKPSSNGPQEPGRDSQTPRSTENDRSPEENDPPSESEPQDSHTPAEKSPSGRRSPRLEFHEDDNFNSSKNSYDKKPLTPTSSAGQSNHDPSHPQSPRERDQSSPEPRESEHQMDESRPKKDRQSAGNETDRSRARQESRNYEQMSGNDRRSLSPISEAGEGENTNPNRASSPADSRDGGTRDGRPSYDFSQVRDRTVDSPEDMRSNDSMSPERYRSHSFSYSPGRLQSQLRGDSRRFSRDTSPPPGYHHMADGNVYYNMNQEGGVINPMYPIRPDPLTALLQKYSGPVPSFQFPGVQPLGHENHYGKGSNGLPSTPPKYPISSNNGFSPARVALSPRQPDSFPSPATPTRSRSLDAEMPRQSNQEFYYCHLCSYVGNSKFHFNAHMNSHFEHACPHCDYTSRTEGRLKRHIKDFHTEEVSESGQMMRRQPGRPKIFKCRQCEFVTENKEQFWDHSRTHIKDDKILQCPKCPFVTEYKHHLEYHLRNHFGSKPFKCPKCNYSCVNKSMLNSHMKSHTNVYQYRCADCTYATKYCHSLKLHLKKYNHKPATVLNPDGSLPTDGSGDFELVSKRGPPRGPRGPKRDSKSPPPPSQAPVFPSPNMMMTPPQPPVAIMSAPSGPMPPQMNGSMVATNNYWSPSMLGQTPSAIQGHPPPLIPVSTVSTMNPLNVQVPPTSRSFPSNHLNPSSLGHKEAQDLSNKYSPVEADGSLNLTSKPIEISPITSGMPMKCRFCEFSADSRQILLQHNLRVHAAENQDLFTVFGIRAETLVGGGEEQQSSEAIREAIMRSSSMLGIKSEDQPRSSLVASSSPPAVIKHSPSFAMKETVSQDIMASIEAETRQSSESPLDLSTIDKYSNGTQIDDDDPKAYAVSCRKRSSDDSQNSYDGLTPSDSMSSSPRKRSRKGKAYKLDVISMKLQGRFDGSPALNEDAEEEECVLSDYASDDNKLDASQSEPDRTILSQPHESVEEISYNLAERNDESNSDNQESTHKSPNVHEDTSFNSKLSRVAEIPNAHKVLQVMQRLEAEYGGRQGKPRLSLDYKASTNGEKSDDEISKFECLHCGIFFSDCIMYTMHMGYHGYKDPFKCNMCGHQSSDKVEFFLHIARAAHA